MPASLASAATEIRDRSFRVAGRGSARSFRRPPLLQGRDKRPALRADQHPVVQLAQDACAQNRKLDRIVQGPQQAQHDLLDGRLHSARHQASHPAGCRSGASRARLRGDLGSDLGRHAHVEFNIDRKQGPSGAGHGFHPERNRHRYRQIVLFIVEIGLAFKHALLASLQHEHRARLVEHGNVAKDRLRSENADAMKGRRIVSLLRGKVASQFH